MDASKATPIDWPRRPFEFVLTASPELLTAPDPTAFQVHLPPGGGQGHRR